MCADVHVHMAAQTRGDNSGVLFHGAGVQVAQCGNVQVGRAVEEQVNLRRCDNNDHLLMNNSYIRTNYFIRCSREFLHKHKLRQFIYFRGLIFCFFLCTLTVIPIPLVPPKIGYPWGAAGAVLMLLWSVVFTQHMNVITRTLRVVMKQPTVSDATQKSMNAFYEITLARLEGVFLQAKNQGMGLLKTNENSQSIQFQVFNEKGMKVMKKAIQRSISMFVISCLELTWCLAWIGVQVYWEVNPKGHPLYNK